MVPAQEKHVLKLERIQRIVTKIVPDLEDLTYEERLKELHLKTLKERREKGDLIAMYDLMNNLEAKYLIEHKKKLQKRICLNYTK